MFLQYLVSRCQRDARAGVPCGGPDWGASPTDDKVAACERDHRRNASLPNCVFVSWD